MTFSPILAWPLLISLLTLTGMWMLWIEWGRKERLRLYRFLAVACVIISITIITIRPSYKTTANTGTIVLTKNYNAQSIDSLLQLGKFKLLQLDNVKSFRNSSLLTSLHDLEALAQPVIIAGEGIPTSYKNYLQKITYTYLPSPTPEGILSIEEAPYKLNQESQIKFLFNNQSGNNKLILNDPTGKIDSVEINQPGIQSKAFTFTPKQVGTFLYSIKIIHEGDTISNKIPITIESPKKLNILILSNYPTAELRFLKNYLADQQHAISIRNQVSKQTFQNEFINRAATSLAITPALLSENDLIILHQETYTTLSEREYYVIETAIQQGLGMILLADETILKGSRKFNWVQGHKITSDTASLIVQRKQYKTSAVPIQLQNHSSVVPITQSTDGRILSAYAYSGKGKTGIQLLSNSYQLILQGHAMAHAQLWANLIDKITRDKSEDIIRVESPFTLQKNDPIQIELISSSNNPELQFDSIALPLRESPIVDNFCSTTAYAKQSGWHIIETRSKSRPLYVFDSTNLNAMRIYEQINTMKGFSKQQNSEIQQIDLPVPLLYFYLLFLLGAGFLWLVPKL